MSRFGLLSTSALLLGIALAGPLLGAGKVAKPPKRAAPKVHHQAHKPGPKPHRVTHKSAHHPTPHKKATPKAKLHVEPKVKPAPRKPVVPKPLATVKNPPIKEKPKDPVKELRREQIANVHHFAHFNERTGEYSFDSRWWYSFCVYPGTVGRSYEGPLNFEAAVPPAGFTVAPPVIKAGQGLPLSPAGQKLAALLDGLDVEEHWLSGQKVNWRTGNATEEAGGPASNAGAFVAAVCARLKAPLARPVAENFLPGSQYDWLVQTGKDKGWVAVEAVEAQLLANQGWVVVAAWKDFSPAGERGLSGQTAIVRPAGNPVGDIAKRGPHIIMAGLKNHNDIPLNEGFSTKAKNDVIYVAYRPR